MAPKDDLQSSLAEFEREIQRVSTAPHPQPQPQHTVTPNALTPAQPTPESTAKPSIDSTIAPIAPTPSSKLAPSSTAPTEATGRWKWTGAAWKWHVTTEPTAANKPAITATTVPTATAPHHTLPTPAGPARPAAHPVPKRVAAGTVWRDDTLADWPASDHRIFVGDLAPDATDAELEAAFRQYSSFNMARTVRDKRTDTCRGYGFVSFARGEDMIAALKEMNGKYVGTRPVKLKKSNWQKRNLNKERRKELKLFRHIAKR